jgi:hypothetical protein
MNTALEVAQWMFQQLESSAWLYQETVVFQIRNKFGDAFVYQNQNGNLAIGKDVLKEFRKLTEGNAIWSKSDRSWRKLRPGENYKGRQED